MIIIVRYDAWYSQIFDRIPWPIQPSVRELVGQLFISPFETDRFRTVCILFGRSFARVPRKKHFDEFVVSTGCDYAGIKTAHFACCNVGYMYTERGFLRDGVFFSYPLFWRFVGNLYES